MTNAHTAPGSYIVPARRGTAFRLPAGARVRVVNTHGTQVVDTWAFNADDPSEHMSMEHTRASILRLTPRVGEAFMTNHRRPILRLVDDASPGVHDTLMPSCDRYRYEQLGASGYHDNCADNLVAALASESITLPYVPSPLNLFMNVPIGDDAELAFDAPVTQPGDSVRLAAELPAIVVLSACPQDMIPVNGLLMAPRDVAVVVER